MMRIRLALLAALGAFPALAQDALLGDWRVARIDGAAPVAPITLRFGADGRLSGKASCNRYGATYRLEGASLSVSAPMATRMACAPAVMAQEARFLALIAGVTRVSLARGALTLTAADGAALRAIRAGE